jgi:hypothetical protein
LLAFSCAIVIGMINQNTHAWFAQFKLFGRVHRNELLPLARQMGV